MKINSIDNSQRQNFGMLKIAPDAQKLIGNTARKASSEEWVKKLTNIHNATERLKNTRFGDIIIDIKNNDYSKPACLVFLTALTKPVIEGWKIVKEEIEGNATYSDTPIPGQVAPGTGISVTPYDSLDEAISVVEENEKSALATEKTLQQQIEDQKLTAREKEERRLQEMRERDERKQQELRDAQERQAKEAEGKKANRSKIGALLEKLGF